MFSRYIGFCVFVKSTDFKICDIIIGITAKVVVSTYLYHAFDSLLLSHHVQVYSFPECHLNLRYGACFEQGVPWHSGKL